MSPASMVGSSGVVAELNPSVGAVKVTLPVMRSASESAASSPASTVVNTVSAGLTNSMV
ncbi:MAG: hypothetical protein BWY91_00807 [bacterium ADurb.BinA028]|nr:MAG: hypothetical protein BWY91_00807 [bacterium ADurb.BinA028]